MYYRPLVRTYHKQIFLNEISLLKALVKKEIFWPGIKTKMKSDSGQPGFTICPSVAGELCTLRNSAGEKNGDKLSPLIREANLQVGPGDIQEFQVISRLFPGRKWKFGKVDFMAVHPP